MVRILALVAWALALFFVAPTEAAPVPDGPTNVVALSGPSLGVATAPGWSSRPAVRPGSVGPLLRFGKDPWEDERVGAIARAQYKELARRVARRETTGEALKVGGGVTIAGGFVPFIWGQSSLDAVYYEPTGTGFDVIAGFATGLQSLGLILVIMGGVVLWVVGGLLIGVSALVDRKAKVARKELDVFGERIRYRAALEVPRWGPPPAAVRAPVSILMARRP